MPDAVKVGLPMRGIRKLKAHRSITWAWPGVYEVTNMMHPQTHTSTFVPDYLWRPCAVLYFEENLSDGTPNKYLYVSSGAVIKPYPTLYTRVRARDDLAREWLGAYEARLRLELVAARGGSI